MILKALKKNLIHKKNKPREFYDLKKIAQGRQRKLLCKIKNIYE